MPEPLMVPVTLTLSNAPGGKKRNSPESPHELPLNASPHVPSSPNTANEETSKFILNHERMTSYGSAVARDSADAGFETQMDSLPQQIPLRGSTGGLRVEDLSLSSPKSSSADSVDFLTPPPGATGLSNLGNTCFMNSALQCLSHSGPLTAYFLAGPWEKELNRDNPLGLDGKIAKAYAHLIENLWDPRPPKAHSFSPREFKYTIGTFNSMFSGYSQQDSQELLQSLLDGLHEDLNRILKKPYVEVPDMDDLSDSDKAQKSWELYSLRNDSVIVDLFQGQYKSRVECISCGKWSVKFDPYMFLSLPIPGVKETVVTVTVVPRSLHLSETNEPLRKSTKVDIIMPKASSIGDLLKKVSTMFNWPSEYVSAPIVLEVYDSKVFRFLQNHEPVSSIGKQDLVCILEPDYGDESFAMIQWEEMPSFQKGPAATLDPELLENARTNCTRLPVYLTHTYASVSSETENRLGSGLGTPFGIPFSLCLPRKVSVTIPHDIAKTLTEEQVHYEAKRLFGIYLYMHLMVNMVRYISGPLIQQKEDATLQDFIDFLIQNDLSWDNYSAGCKLTLVEKSLQEDQRDYDTFFSRGYANHHLASHTVLFPLDCSDLDESGPNLEETEPPGIPQPSEDRIVSFEFDTSAKLLVVQWDSDNAKNMLGEECVTKLPSFSSAPTTNVFSPLEHPKNKETVASFESKKGHGKKINLESCINEYSKEETLGEQDTWYCSDCKEHRRIKKKIDIWSVPDVLVFHLKRFSNSGRFSYGASGDKIDSFVDAPVNGLDMRQFVKGHIHSSDMPAEDLIYDLHAVSNHFGGLGGGHYTAYAKNPIDQRWYNLDDSHTSPIEESTVMTKAAYLLFYTRRKAAVSGSKLKELLSKFEPRAAPIMALSQSSSVLTSRPVPMVPTFSAPPSYNNIGPVFDSYSIETVPTYGPSLPFATDEDSKEQDIGWSDPQIDFPSPSQTGFTFGSVVAPSPIIDDDVPFENAHVRRDSGASLFNDLSDIDGDEEDEVGPGPDMDTDQAVNGLMTSNTQPLWFHQDPMGGEKDS